MNILKRLKEAVENAAKSLKKTDGQSALDKLKEEVGSPGKDALPEKPVLPETPKYEEMDKDLTDDDELKNKAEDSLKDYENKTLGAIDEQNKSDRELFEKSKEEAEKAAEKNTKSVEQLYGEAMKNTSDDLLKRGIARSSIAANKTSELESQRAEALGTLNTALNQRLSQLDIEIGALSGKRQKAIDDFNISLTVKLGEKLDELKKERDKTNAEALKYNNELKKQSGKDELDRLKLESDLYSGALDQKKKENALKGDPSTLNDFYNASYQKMDSTLSGMSKSEAAALIKGDDFFKNNLSEYLYYKLYDKYCR